MKTSLCSFIFFLIAMIPIGSIQASFLPKAKKFEIPRKVKGQNLLKGEMFEWSFQKSASQNHYGFKGTVISFLSSKCPCSNSHLKHLIDLQEKFPQFLFIGIHSNKKGKKKEIQSFFRTKKLSFPLLFDSSLELANSFRALKTPHIFVISKKGELLFHGGITNSINFKFATKFYLKEALTKIKNKKPLEKIYARAIGCSIAR